MIDSTVLAISSAELDATDEHPFIARRTPDAAKEPLVEYTVNAQGTILNAKFASARPAVAAAISEFVAAHNARIVSLRANSGLADLR